jgi:carbon-monoxide dehydrogenase large subunit
MAISRMVGARVKRKEDPRLITGAGNYVDDIKLHDMQHLALLRSPHAHARIKSIDTSKAASAPGVRAVLTGGDIKRMSEPLPTVGGVEDLKTPDHPAMAIEEVNHLGEIVAGVVAADRYLARDAVDLIEVEYEVLPAVIDMEKAIETGSPLVHEDLGTNIGYRMEVGTDVDAAFRDADVVVKQRMSNQRLIPNPLENRGVVAHYEQGPATLTVWTSTQIPHMLRGMYATLLRLPEQRVRVVAPDVGGGFGCKLNVYPEDIITACAAMAVRKPVKWIEERSEGFLATSHGRDQLADVEAAAKKDGTITGLRFRVLADLGAYNQLFTPLVPTFTGAMASGCYEVANIKCEIMGVYTNKTATDAYRGAGRPEAAYYLERIVDIVADELELDPAEVRRKNFIPPSAFPYATPTGQTYDSGNYELTLNRVLEMANMPKLREEQAKARSEGRFIGIGFSTYVEICGIGGWESATVRVDGSGKATVLTGSSPHGQGQETSFAQLAADELGLPMEDVLVVHGDTSVVATGIGTFGSRAMAVGGGAVVMSTTKVKDKAKQIASHMMEALPDDVVYSEGRMYVRGHAEKGLTLGEVAAAAWAGTELPPDTEPGLEATSHFNPAGATFPFGAHLAVVEIDPDSGQVKLLRYIAVDDCGTPINPLLIDGQVHGGIAQGVGQALYEEAIYDSSGQLITGSLMDYALPTAAMLPAFEMDRTETPTPNNPLGAKGVGEAGTIGTAAAVVNAVVDALSPLGVRHVDMPVKPEKIWRIMQSRGNQQ